MALPKEMKLDVDVASMIEKFLKKEIERVFDNAIKDVLKNFERRRSEIVAGTLINVMRTTDMRVHQDNIIFTIKKEK